MIHLTRFRDSHTKAQGDEESRHECFLEHLACKELGGLRTEWVERLEKGLGLANFSH